MVKRLIRVAVPLAVVLAIAGAILLLVLFALGRPEKRVASIEKIQARDGVPVDVVRPVRTAFTPYITCDGSVSADVRAMLRAKVAEVVEGVHARVGERVSKGQLLVEFRRTDLDEAVRAANATYAEAKNNCERFATLLEQDVVAEDRYDQMKTAMENAASALSAAESRLAFAEVLSPIDGVVSERFVEPGEYKGMGDELLAIVDLSTVEVRALVPEQHVAALALGSAGEIQLASGSDWLSGSVSRVSPSTTDPNRFFDVFLKVENPRTASDWLMRAGMYAEVRFPQDVIPDAPALPDGCVRLEGGERAVYVVRSETRQVALEDPVDPPTDEAEDTVGRRIARGWHNLRSRFHKSDEGADQAGDEPAYSEVQAAVARRLIVKVGLREENLLQILADDLADADLVILRPRDAIRDGVVVAVSPGGAAE